MLGPSQKFVNYPPLYASLIADDSYEFKLTKISQIFISLFPI